MLVAEAKLMKKHVKAQYHAASAEEIDGYVRGCEIIIEENLTTEQLYKRLDDFVNNTSPEELALITPYERGIYLIQNALYCSVTGDPGPLDVRNIKKMHRLVDRVVSSLDEYYSEFEALDVLDTISAALDEYILIQANRCGYSTHNMNRNKGPLWTVWV